MQEMERVFPVGTGIGDNNLYLGYKLGSKDVYTPPITMTTRPRTLSCSKLSVLSVSSR